MLYPFNYGGMPDSGHYTRFSSQNKRLAVRLLISSPVGIAAGRQNGENSAFVITVNGACCLCFRLIADVVANLRMAD